MAGQDITGRAVHTLFRCGSAGLSIGETVAVTDSNGKLLAQGEITKDISADYPNAQCAAQWTVKDVPEGADGYRIRVGEYDPKEFDWLELLDDPSMLVG